MNTSKKILVGAGLAVLALLIIALAFNQKPPVAEKASAATTPAKNSPANTVVDIASARAPVAATAGRPLEMPPPAQPVAQAPAPSSPRDITMPSPQPAAPTAAPVVNTQPTANGSAAAGATPGLHFAPGPADGLATVQSYLNRPMTPAMLRTNPQLADPKSLQINAPIPIYTMSLQTMANGGDLQAAQANGSSAYLIKASDKSYISIAVVGPGMNPNNPGGTTVLNFSRSDLAVSLGSILDQVATLEQIKSGSYEARLIQTPSLVGTGTNQLLWLKSSSAGSDLICFLAFGFAPNTVQPGQVYSASEFFRLVQPIAQQRLGM